MEGKTANCSFSTIAQWIDDFVNPGYEHFGKIAVFNNFINNSFSRGQILEPVWEEATASYLMANDIFLPTGFTESIIHPDSAKTNSFIASSIQLIGDGHVVMMAAQQGFAYELNADREAVWEYKIPLSNGNPVGQGAELNLSENFTFQLERYPEDFPAFIGRDLSAKGFIELDPNISFCLFTDAEELNAENNLTIYPNPASEYLFIENKNDRSAGFTIFNNYGQQVYYSEKNNVGKIEVGDWPQGVYFLKEKNERGAKFFFSSALTAHFLFINCLLFFLSKIFTG